MSSVSEKYLQMALSEAWLCCRDGDMAPCEHAKLWGLRVALRKLCEPDNQYEWMSQHVRVAANGRARGGDKPGRAGVKKFFDRVDTLEEAGQTWYPGACLTKRTGRPVELTAQKKAAITTSMMAAKERGDLPCYELAVARCPSATLNPTTGKAFSRHRINDLLTSECYDEEPEHPWEFRFGRKRRALTQEARVERMEWARRLLREKKAAAWFFTNIIWIDLCSKVIPSNPKKAYDQLQASRNKRRRLMSPGGSSRDASDNSGGSDTAEKQKGFGDTRVWFGVALTRGVLGVTVFTTTEGAGAFPGENPEGVRQFVSRLPQMLNRMLGRSTRKPRVIFSDRGPGFYHRSTGAITGEYETVCREHRFKPWAGNNARRGPRAQPPDIPDVLLHETAISHLRERVYKSTPRKPWEETPKELETRLRAAEAYANAEYRLADLCRELPKRLENLVKVTHGDRLPK